MASSRVPVVVAVAVVASSSSDETDKTDDTEVSDDDDETVLLRCVVFVGEGDGAIGGVKGEGIGGES